MKGIKIVCVLVFGIFAALAVPMGMFSFTAAESALMQASVHDEGVVREHLTAAVTVEDFLREAGVQVGGLDSVSHSLAAPIWNGMVITIEREVPFYVQVDSGLPDARASRPGLTVESAMLQLQREIGMALLFDGEQERPVTAGETLNFISRQARFEVETFPIPYETIENITSSVSAGRTHLRQVGSYGEYEITTAITYIGGIENNREVISTEVVLEPVNAILDIGTGWLGSLTDVTAPDFHYFTRIRMEATAYTAGYSCTGKHPCDPWYRITASGREVEHGIVAVDRSIIPLGTRLYVENYGFALAADVGGAIRGYKIDLFMEEMSDALQFGRRHIYVWILDEIPYFMDLDE